MAANDSTRLQFVRVCECGCGQPTMLIPQSDTAKGYIKGQPHRFIGGHICHVLPKRPIKTALYSNTRTGDGPLLKVHRVRAERALGHPLPPGAEVHHPDEDKQNPNARLVICQDRAYHLLLHACMRIVKAGGNPQTQAICAYCKQLQPLTAFGRNRSRSDGRDAICKPCWRVYRVVRKTAIALYG